MPSTKEVCKAVAQEVWDKVEKADGNVLTEDDLYKHLVKCSKGSAQAEWNARGFIEDLEDLGGLDEETIKVRCAKVFAVLDGEKREGKASFDDAFESLCKKHDETFPCKLAQHDDMWLKGVLMPTAAKFEGCIVTTGEDKYNFFLTQIRVLFDAIDTNKSGLLEGNCDADVGRLNCRVFDLSFR